jgi:hypothetical protein
MAILPKSMPLLIWAGYDGTTMPAIAFFALNPPVCLLGGIVVPLFVGM